MKNVLLALSSFVFAIQLMAQYPGITAGKSGAGKNMNVGHFYGKVVDSKTNKGIDGATVQLTGNKFDTATKAMKTFIYATMLTSANGDFSLENLPVFGNFKLQISNVGFKNYSQQISFNIKFPQGGGATANANNNSSANSDNTTAAISNAQQMIGMIDKDLGNIKLDEDASTLAAVVVSASKPFFEMGVDRKIFNVSQSIVTTGQTATEVMKQIPTLNVDIDGNVTLRNATPTLFIDGRPTTLTYDQIPADIIDRVELITNPSAKYDASGGQGGIINIVLKKNNKSGYNGGVRTGVDSRGKMNYGADLNYRQNKINFFFNGAYNQRLSKITSSTDRATTDPATEVNESGLGQNNGHFAFLRAGFDYFIDNRNTLTIGGNIVHGNFANDQPQLIDSIFNGVEKSFSNVASVSTFDFKNYGAQLSFKHNFAKANHDITADFNFNRSNNINNSYINTYTYFPDFTSSQNPSLQQTLGNGYNQFITIQSDYENPLTENTKLEAGVRAALRNYYSLSDIYFHDSTNYGNDSLKYYTYQPGVSSQYKYNDAVYAAYADYTIKSKKWNYQFGLRVESSNYKGVSLDSATEPPFKTNFPLSLFPSAFITYKLNSTEDFQLNYSRRIDRPTFFQLSPIVNISNPENISIGNPDLKPEFTDAFEFSYDKTYAHGGNFLATVYFKYSTGLITNYVYQAPSPLNGSDTAYFNTYENANYSYSYGLELTNKVTIARIWDLTANVNFFDSKIDASNVQTGLASSGLSWFGKLNNSFKLSDGYSIQFSGSYQAKTVLPPTSGGGGGNNFFQPVLTSAQGYINPYYGFDMAVRKDWTWKGGNTISFSVGMNDLFRTETVSTYSVSQFFTQTTSRLRDPQLVRINLSYRFGKLDASLFKRKDLKADQGADTGTMGGQ
jgi:outer membrane receptor protein involved in Fe transport